jgi:hypothetical protein
MVCWILARAAFRAAVHRPSKKLPFYEKEYFGKILLFKKI